MFLTKISVRHPVFATMVMVALLVFGLYSYSRLSIEQMPNIDLPVVAVDYRRKRPERPANGYNAELNATNRATFGSKIFGQINSGNVYN